MDPFEIEVSSYTVRSAAKTLRSWPAIGLLGLFKSIPLHVGTIRAVAVVVYEGSEKKNKSLDLVLAPVGTSIKHFQGS